MGGNKTHCFPWGQALLQLILGPWRKKLCAGRGLRQICRDSKAHDLITCKSKVQVVWGSEGVTLFGHSNVLARSENAFELGSVTKPFINPLH